MKAERAEGNVQVLILITVAGMAGAGSFTHVHDWTMHNVPPGTGSWLGWANAVITELVPAAAGIEIRRRKRQHRPVTYPMTILVADVVISLSVQLSDATHTLAGGIAFALPALAFLALTKLVLSRTRTATGKEATECAAQPAPASDAPQQATAPSAATSTGAHATATSTISTTPSPQDSRSSSPDASALTASPSDSPRALPPGQLLISARMAAFSHQQQTGNPITPGELATRMSIPAALAESLLDQLDGTPPPVTAVNGTVLNGSCP